MERIWIIFALMVMLALACIRVGYHFGRIAEFNKWSNGFYEEFKKKFTERLTVAFQKKVEERAMALYEKMIEEKEKQDESIGSN